MDIKIEIKEEPNATLNQIKSEYEELDDFHSETVFVSPHLVKRSPNNSEMCKKIEIKEEPFSCESTSNEIKQDIELPSAAEVHPKNEIKETTSHTEVITGDLSVEEVSRLYTELIFRNSDSASSFCSSENSEDIILRNNDANITKTPQMFTEPPTDTLFDIDIKSSLIHSSRTTHKCEICNKSFNRLSELNNHKRMHEEKRTYTCEICSRSFGQASNLRQHKLIHEGKRPYTCEICNKSFTHSPNLKQHKLIHEGKRPYTCVICNKSFTQSSHLKHHKLTHEGTRPYTCEVCNKSFTKVSNLRRHKLNHESKRRYTCDICKKNFTDASCLKKHKLVHKNIRPHTCKVCNKSYNKILYLREHKLNHEVGAAGKYKFWWFIKL